MAGDAITFSELHLKVVVDDAETGNSKLAKLKKSNDGLADSFKQGLAQLTGFVSGFALLDVAKQGLDLLVGSIKDVIDAGMEQQKIEAQTNAVIKSTGGAAHISAAQVGEMADRLALMSGVSNDAIAGAENLLLTFTNIGQKVFPQATSAVLDMSVAMHEDLQTAAIQVGKALNDPILGVTALRRVGVQLSDSQVELVKHFMATGNAAAAQGIILKELNKEFGGSAEAAGKTLPGMLDRLNESWDQAKEKIAGAVLPVLQDLVEKYVIPAAEWFGDHLPAAIKVLTDFMNGTLIPTVNAFMDSPLVTTVEGWATAIATKLTPSLAGGDKSAEGGANKAKTAVKNLDDRLGGTTNNMAGPYVKRIQTAIDKLDGMTTSLGGTTPKGGSNDTVGLNPAVKKLNDNLDKADAKLNAAAKAADGAKQPVEFLGGIFDQLGIHVHGALDNIGNFASGISERFGPALPTIQRIGGELQDDFSTFTDGIRNLWDGLWGSITFPVKIAFHTLEGIFNIGLDLLGGKLNKAEKDANDTFNNLGNDVKDFGASLWGIVKGIFETLIGIPFGVLKGMWKQTEPQLEAFKNSFVDWWNNLPKSIEQAIDNFTHLIQDYINSHMPQFPGIGIPGLGGGTQRRASGGPVSGDFIGAEGGGAELLVTPGVYHAPAGSYVYNAQQTKDILGGGGGAHYNFGPGSVVIYAQDKTAGQMLDELNREIEWRRRGHGG